MLNIINSKAKHFSETSPNVLTEKSFHPCHPFFIHNKFVPESFDDIYLKGILEITPYLRECIKRIDNLLSVGGHLKIDYFMSKEMYVGGEYLRPLSFFMHEFSLAVGNRYKLREKPIENRVCHLVFEKIAATLPKQDSINRWSFGIISDGRKNERVNGIIRQIAELGIPEYEILVCGPAPSQNPSAEVRVLDDSDLWWDIRPPITAKKNQIIRAAKFNNLVLIHDRISFPPDWFKKMQAYGNYFEVLCPQILDESTKTRRVQDWIYLSGDFHDYRNVKGRLLDYETWRPDIYVDGGCLMVKKHLMENVMYNTRLHWGEAEDMDLSKRFYQSGVMTNLFRDCVVLTQTHRHPGSMLNKSVFNEIREKIGLRTKLRKILNHIILSKCFDEYLTKSVRNNQN